MYRSEFDKLYLEFLGKEGEIREKKQAEYTDTLDALKNFRQIGKFFDLNPATIASIYLMKHIQSIVLALETGRYEWCWQTADGREGLKQRIADARNYLLFLAACLEERHLQYLESQEEEKREGN